ncbi:MAG: PA14 domain-containing protein [Thermoflexibacter sp.]|nr:PA14 domain-containing protein [Thermoflexibacter sp.]
MKILFKIINAFLLFMSILFPNQLLAQVNSKLSIKTLEKPRIALHRGLQRSSLTESNVKIPNLKAVLLGAPIDGDNGTWTQAEIANLKKVSAALQRNGVEVYEFYTPNNNWEEIKKAANGAHFLLYRGHGVYDGSEPPKWVGGFSLKDKFVSSEEVIKDLKLAKGAIVMLYGCFTAGNAGGDIGKIGLQEAQRRVAMYAKPFMEMGVSAYYANWFGDAFEKYVSFLFEGKSTGDAYKNYTDFNEKTVKYGKHPQIGAMDMWIDHDVWDGKTAYNNTFVGNPNQSLTSLFGKNSSSNTSTNNMPDSNNNIPTNNSGNNNLPSSNNAEIVFISNKNINGTSKTYQEIWTELKGKVIYTDVWASWCAPCLEEMPYSQQMRQKFDAKDVAFVYFSVDNSESQWKKAIIQKNIKGYHVRLDPDSDAYHSFMEDFNISGIPHFILIDKKGNISDSDASRPSDESTEEAIQKLVNTKQPSKVINAINANKLSRGLKAYYYVGDDLVQEKVDAVIDFDWSEKSPLGSGQMEDYQVIWTGSIVPKYSENYTFYTNSDDGVTLSINGITLIDQWHDQPATEWSGEIRLEAGRKYEIEIYYYQAGGGAVMQLMWESPSQKKEIVPNSQLYKD